MKRTGRARRELLVAMCPSAEFIVDVGADHGHVAHAVGAIATERAPNRAGRGDVPWVIADGLKPFRRVPCAIIAGMGAETIARILQDGPRPDVAVLHAQDDPPRLRRLLAADDWRIEAEGLAPEAGRYAEVLRVVPGRETATGLWLDFGPVLLRGNAPHKPAHLAQLIGHYERLAHTTRHAAPAIHADMEARVVFLRERLAECES